MAGETAMTDARAQHWAAVIREEAADANVMATINAINSLTAAGHVNRAAVIVACAQMLAQCIGCDAEIAAEIRAGIMALIDGFAMQVAVERT